MKWSARRSAQLASPSNLSSDSRNIKQTFRRATECTILDSRFQSTWPSIKSDRVNEKKFHHLASIVRPLSLATASGCHRNFMPSKRCCAFREHSIRTQKRDYLQTELSKQLDFNLNAVLCVFACTILLQFCLYRCRVFFLFFFLLFLLLWWRGQLFHIPKNVRARVFLYSFLLLHSL